MLRSAWRNRQAECKVLRSLTADRRTLFVLDVLSEMTGSEPLEEVENRVGGLSDDELRHCLAALTNPSLFQEGPYVELVKAEMRMRGLFLSQ